MDTDTDDRVFQARGFPVDENHVDLLNHCVICLTHFDSESCGSGRVVVEGVSFKHLWNYFEVTCGEDGGGGDSVNQSLKSWSFVDSMKTEMTTSPPLCLKCSDVVFELNKRHQELMGKWKSFQSQLKLLQNLLTEEENMRRYKEFQETLDCADIKEHWKIKTKQFLKGIRINEAGGIFPGGGLRSHLESWDGNEEAEIKKEESLDEDDNIGIDKCEDERMIDYNDIAADCDNASTVSNEGIDKSSELDSYPVCVEVDDESDDSDYEPSSENIDTSEDEEAVMDIRPVSHSQIGNAIAKRRNQLDSDPLAEISAPSTSKKMKASSTSFYTSGPAKASPRIVDCIDLTEEQTEIAKIGRSKPAPPPTYFEVAIKKCHLCDRFFATKDFKRHIIIKHGKHPYTCDICGDNILPEDFRSHLEAHVGDYITKCANPTCSYVAVNYQRLWKLHLSRHEKDEACKDVGMTATDFNSKYPAKCESCTFTTDTFNRLYTHVIECHEAKSVNKSLSCPVATCEKKFAYRQTIERHLSDHVLNNLIHEEQHCKVCNIYMAPDFLAEHLKEFHKVTEIVKCEYCPYIFGERIHLLNHMCDVHVKTMDGVCCDICKGNGRPGYNYKLIMELRRHYYEVHHIGQPLVCEKCCFTTYSKMGFNIHLSMNDHEKYKHSEKKESLKCEICNVIFHSVEKHWKHMRYIHNDKKPKPYKKKIREYACEYCDRIFENYNHLVRHSKSDHPKTYVCESCGKSFTRSSALAGHRKLHEGERPFVCEVCSHAFAQQGDLNSHMRIHTGERPYKCSMCSESFRQRTGLRKHSLAVHQVDKTYVCSRDASCGKSFTTYKELAHHEIREHENVCHLCTEERKEFKTRKELNIHMRAAHRNTFNFKCDQCETVCATQFGLEVHCKKMHKL